MHPHTAQKNANQFLEDDMTDTKNEPNGEVELVAFNMRLQIALDKEGNVWKVDSWRDEDGNELDIDDIDSEDSDWALVEYVTAWSDHIGKRQWCAFRPDDFDRPTEG